MKSYQEWEKDHQRAYDWQDKLVIGGSLLTCLACIALLIEGVIL